MRSSPMPKTVQIRGIDDDVHAERTRRRPSTISRAEVVEALEEIRSE